MQERGRASIKKPPEGVPLKLDVSNFSAITELNLKFAIVSQQNRQVGDKGSRE